MASAVHIGVALCNTMVNAAVDTIDAGTNYLKVFTGSIPAECATADSGTQLVSITLPTPAFGASADTTNECTAAKDGTWSGTAGAGGDAGYFRIYDDTVCIAQGTAGELADAPDLEFDEKTIASGATITITTFGFALPYNPEG